MTTTEIPSLRSLILAALAEDADADPRSIAELVADRIPEDVKQQVLLSALTWRVRSVMSQDRNTALSHAFTPAPAARPAQPAVCRPSLLPPTSRPSSIQAESIDHRPNRSAKVAGIRDWWSDMLASRVHVGDKQWKPLGECGVKELQFAETERRDQAERHLKTAKMYLRLRQLLDEHEVSTVAELPSDAVKAFS